MAQAPSHQNNYTMEDPENSETGGRKMSRRKRNIDPYPQHMTGILGPIEKYHSKKVGYKNSLKKYILEH